MEKNGFEQIGNGEIHFVADKKINLPSFGCLSISDPIISTSPEFTFDWIDNENWNMTSISGNDQEGALGFCCHGQTMSLIRPHPFEKSKYHWSHLHHFSTRCSTVEENDIIISETAEDESHCINQEPSGKESSIVVKLQNDAYREGVEHEPIQKTDGALNGNVTSSGDSTSHFSLSVKSSSIDGKCDGDGLSEDDQDNSGGETELPEIDPGAEDRELKNHLLKKYSGYLGSLKQELSKKKKKEYTIIRVSNRQDVSSPREGNVVSKNNQRGRQRRLLYRINLVWIEKMINNRCINQRRRHWKPSEDMQFVVMDGLHAQNAAVYMEGHFMADGNYRLGP
ncbi:hypothetical protein IFM89_038182 [Coptis chinensis]|uniref:ELK domain-containing protein n=1 Tax=Coptis chinensis TaxID=261450 RepID=A0A835M2Y4_9MAGN|nr:hypothetical protein IFM89_038182 [Coptis chinensis]